MEDAILQAGLPGWIEKGKGSRAAPKHLSLSASCERNVISHFKVLLPRLPAMTDSTLKWQANKTFPSYIVLSGMMLSQQGND